MDHRLIERIFRGAVAGRKPSFGSDSEEGAAFTAILYSVTGTLAMIGIHVRRWLHEGLGACARNGGRRRPHRPAATQNRRPAEPGHLAETTAQERETHPQPVTIANHHRVTERLRLGDPPTAPAAGEGPRRPCPRGAVAHPAGLEPATSASGGQRSIRLSYGCRGRGRSPYQPPSGAVTPAGTDLRP